MINVSYMNKYNVVFILGICCMAVFLWLIPLSAEALSCDCFAEATTYLGHPLCDSYYCGSNYTCDTSFSCAPKGAMCQGGFLVGTYPNECITGCVIGAGRCRPDRQFRRLQPMK